MKRLTATVDPKLHSEIKMQAIREGLTIQQLTEKIFIQYLKGRKPSQPADAALHND